MRTYFAHPVSDYGTALEAEAIRFMKGRVGVFGHIVNPNEPRHNENYKKHGMGYFVGLVEALDACVFMRMPCGSLGAGVALEVKSFIDRGLPVIELSREDFDYGRHTEMPDPILSVEETRTAIRKILEERAAEAEALPA